MMWMMMVAACSLVIMMLGDDSTVKGVKPTKTGGQAEKRAGVQPGSQTSPLASRQKKI